MEHISLDSLEQYSRGKTPLDRVAPLEEHLLVCEHCRQALQRIEEEARIMRDALSNLDPPTQQ